jgi:glycosyltransferase involved in cell wall biosynthesis
MTDTLPKVSIGMPIYNGAGLMRAAIEALLAQTFTDFELILSDNGSTDETSAICAEYVQRDARVRYVRQATTLPVIENFGFVLGAARGQYFMWQACDDLWRPVWLERAVAVLDEEPEAALVFSNFDLHDHATGQQSPAACVIASCGTMRNRVITRILNPTANIIYGLFRRELVPPEDVRAVDFFDVLFTLKIAVEGHIHVLSERLFVAGKRPGRKAYSLTHRRIVFWPYFQQARALVRRHFRGFDRLLLTVLLLRQVGSWYRMHRVNGG